MKKVAIAFMTIFTYVHSSKAEPVQCAAIHQAVSIQADSILALNLVVYQFAKDMVGAVKFNEPRNTDFDKTKEVLADIKGIHDVKKVLAGIEALKQLCPDTAKAQGMK